MPAYKRKDSAYRRAKQEGYRSRAVYKLEELDRRFKLFRRGMRVVDLGCWPGAWLQYAAERVGPQGRVVGVDLEPITDLGRPNVHFMQGNVSDPGMVERIQGLLSGPADLVLSDLAPKLTGVKHTDAVRHADLARVALEGARSWLAPRGTFVVKLFMNSEYPALAAELRQSFEAVRSWRPDTTRHGSSEMYACAQVLRETMRASEDRDQEALAGFNPEKTVP